MAVSGIRIVEPLPRVSLTGIGLCRKPLDRAGGTRKRRFGASAGPPGEPRVVPAQLGLELGHEVGERGIDRLAR